MDSPRYQANLNVLAMSLDKVSHTIQLSKGAIMSNTKTLTFTVTIKYESVDGDDLNLCTESAAANLEMAIDNERANGALTPNNICASAAVVALNA